MSEPLPVRVMVAIETGLRVARENPKLGESPASEDDLAWCIWNDLRRAGFVAVDATPRHPSLSVHVSTYS